MALKVKLVLPKKLSEEIMYIAECRDKEVEEVLRELIEEAVRREIEKILKDKLEGV